MKLEISDGTRSLDLLSGGNIYAVQEGFELPLPGRDVTYIEPVDGDGRRRIRTKDTNGEGRIATMISGTSDANFWDNIDNLLELVQSAHRNRGSITYRPPTGADEITWDLEAITVTGLPQRGQQLSTRRAECEIGFETRPYGKLPGTIVDLGDDPELVLDGPIDYAPVENIAGQIEAFAELKLTDTSGQNRRHVEVGVQDVFDPDDPEPLLLTAGTMSAAQGTLDALAGIAGTVEVPTGAYTTSGGDPYALRCVVSNTPGALLTTGEQPHSGLWKVRARVNASDQAIRIRLAWRVGGGQFTKEQWRVISGGSRWVSVDLGTVDIPKLQSGHTWEARVEGISAVGFPKVFVDYLALIPADRFMRVRGLEIFENAQRLIAGDDFQSHAAGTLAGKTPPLASGGTWVSSGAGGTVNDFVVAANPINTVNRAKTGDSTTLAGRFARPGTATFEDTQILAEVLPLPSIGGTYFDYPDSTSGTLGDFSKGQAGVVFRYTDTDNYVKAFYTRNVYERYVNLFSNFVPSSGGNTSSIFGWSFELTDLTIGGYSFQIPQFSISQFEYTSLHLQKVVGGTVTSLGRVDFGPIGSNTAPSITGPRRLQIIAGTAGDIEVWEGPQGDSLVKQIEYPGDAQLATGGTLDSGELGLYHANTGGTADSTQFFSLFVQDPSANETLLPAIRANNSLELTHNAAYTLAGTTGDRTPSPIKEGEYLRLRPATRNGSHSRIVVMARRSDPELGQTDTGLADQIEATLEVTPRVTLK